MKTAIRCRKCSQVFEVKGNDMDNICEPCYEGTGPAALVGALQDPVHKEIGPSRPAKSRKVDPKNLEAMRARMANARAARAAKAVKVVTADMGLQKDISARVTYQIQADGEMKLMSYSEDEAHPDSALIESGMTVLDEPGFVDTQPEGATVVGSNWDPPEE